MNKITTQDAINELLRMKKQLLGPQGCSVKSQEVNEYKAKCISMAINALCVQREKEAP